MKAKKTIFLIAVSIIIVAIVAFAFLSAIKPMKPGSVQQKSQPEEVPQPEEKDYPVEAVIDPNPFMQEVLNNYNDYVQEAIHKGLTPGAAVAIVKDSSIIFLKGFGVKQAGKPDTINTNTVFRLGSVSKCFASVLTGTLVREQIINWDDPVIKYLPEFALKSREYTEMLTVRHVLSHTMGLPYHAFTNMIEERAPLDTLLKELRYLDLIGEPGKVYSYQNVGYSVIGKVIETATHQSFEAMLNQKLFQPLHMKNSSASYESIIKNENIALPHLMSRKHWVSTKISNTYYDVAPAGGVNASIADMALWLKALLGNKQEVLDNKILDQIFEPQVRAISKNRNFWQWQRPKASYYALGWRVLAFKNDTIEYHGGYVNGYRSEVAIDRKNKLAICILTNSAGNLPDQAIPKFFMQYSKKSDSIAIWENRHRYLLVNNSTNLKDPVLN